MTANNPTTSKKLVTIYTDGACLGNPGPGGWSAILIYGKTEKELTGAEPQTTNNRMELMAAIEGLQALKEPCVVHVFSDSRYLVDAFQKRWLKEWELRGWRKADGKPVKNDDLWRRLLTLTGGHEVVFHHVSGHSGQEYNERCDRLAVSSAESLSKGHGA